MKRDQLEQFISDHREAFDSELPSLKVWAEIDLRVNRRSRRRALWHYAQIAAAIALLLTVGAIIGTRIPTTSQPSATAILKEVAPEFLEMEQYYNQQIDTKIQQLANYEPGESVLYDLEQLDATMAELKAELAEAPKGQEAQIVANLIKTYQTKIAILERVLERLELQQPTPQNLERNATIL